MDTHLQKDCVLTSCGHRFGRDGYAKMLDRGVQGVSEGVRVERNICPLCRKRNPGLNYIRATLVPPRTPSFPCGSEMSSSGVAAVRKGGGRVQTVREMMAEMEIIEGEVDDTRMVAVAEQTEFNRRIEEAAAAASGNTEDGVVIIEEVIMEVEQEP